jgi:hypothetical protein
LSWALSDLTSSRFSPSLGGFSLPSDLGALLPGFPSRRASCLQFKSEQNMLHQCL